MDSPISEADQHIRQHQDMLRHQQHAQRTQHNRQDPAEEVGGRSEHSTKDALKVQKPAKKGGQGRRRIEIKFIENKSRRQVTFSRRKRGLMKKAYELTTLTGTQALVLIASETGHVYTFATPKLQPVVTLREGKELIQSCLNAPDNYPPFSDFMPNSNNNPHEPHSPVHHSHPQPKQEPHQNSPMHHPHHDMGMYSQGSLPSPHHPHHAPYSQMSPGGGYPDMYLPPGGPSMASSLPPMLGQHLHHVDKRDHGLN
eukprot:CAMPEP_0174261908 /NCGR_PEP_ID=MMETSP0439-20130205/12649_1 /TAXON_ID=0 /ORGANISM="Stereomyxa ramosa, Strain Chinc5" /LENGTH=254 /DNA_ID=CAMNT_0015346515 /DNA_START=112 /DNA_END=876 /DNA_ORIENTATION=-